MSDRDFELRFEQLGLSALPANVSCEATFTPDLHAATVGSAPRPSLLPVEAVEGGTLPQLHFATPDAAHASSTAELTPVRILGEGGMGQVLLARQHSLGREVAVKVLKPNTSNPGAAVALVEEARTAGSLEHPGVVPVYALARDGHGSPALVMRRVDGVCWRELLHDERHPAWNRVAGSGDRLEAHLDVLIQVCNAIAHAHGRGVIHRDIKPANVLLGELGEVYVADWGVAVQKALVVDGPPRLVGTPAYLAPEMVMGDAKLMDERTDVYLLGATLHEVLTRFPPHLGSGLKEVLEKAWRSAPPSFSSELPAELCAICTRALAADPRERFANVLELRDALKLFLSHRGSAVLAQAAAARLATLEQMASAKLDEVEARRWYALISECRFGFAQALETNPGSEHARGGLERCLEVAARRELDGGSAGAARAFLAEMREPPAALTEAVRAFELAEAERGSRAAQFVQISNELDPTVSAPQRNFVMLILALTVGTAMAAFLIGGPAVWNQLVGKWGRLIPVGAVNVVFFVCLAIGRRALLSTRINRQIVAVVGLAAVSLFGSRVQSVLAGTPLEVAVAHDSVMLASMLGVCALVLHWSFFLLAAWYVAAAIVCTLFPDHAAALFGAASLGGLLTSVATYRRWRWEIQATQTQR